MLFLALVVGVLACFANSQQYSEQEMIGILQNYDQETRGLCNRQSHANWNVQTDVGNLANEEAQVSFSEQFRDNSLKGSDFNNVVLVK